MTGLDQLSDDELIGVLAAARRIQSWQTELELAATAALTLTGRAAQAHAGYQPSRTLRHLVKIRSPRCGFPGCRRAAIRCDDDHTIPYHMGGRTSGVLIWTTPSGRTYTVTPEPYPV